MPVEAQGRRAWRWSGGSAGSEGREGRGIEGSGLARLDGVDPAPRRGVRRARPPRPAAPGAGALPGGCPHHLHRSASAGRPRSTPNYADYATTTPTTPPPHDNHAYVVTEESGPGGPGRARVGFESPGEGGRRGYGGSARGRPGAPGSARERNPLRTIPVEGKPRGVRTMRTMRTVRTADRRESWGWGAPGGGAAGGLAGGLRPRRDRPRGGAGVAGGGRRGAGAGAGTGSRRLRIGVSFEVINLSPYDNGYWLTSYGAGQSLYRVTPEDRP